MAYDSKAIYFFVIYGILDVKCPTEEVTYPTPPPPEYNISKFLKSIS